MTGVRRVIAIVALAALAQFQAPGVQAGAVPPEQVVQTWYKLILELVRHTPTYSPPVTSRALAYLGVAGFEAVASGSNDLQSLAGQLNGLEPLSARDTGQGYDEAVVLQAALQGTAQAMFANTGPTGQRAITSLGGKLRAKVAADLPADVVARSESYGAVVAAHILAWSQTDGGAVIENMGFPVDYTLTEGPSYWVPTSAVIQQQKPLLPHWGSNRPFAMPSGATCDLPPPPAYSEDKASEFYKQALEVYDAKQNLTPEQRDMARFWADDAMLSTTPPGHWVSIALQIFQRDNVDVAKAVEVLALLNVAEADAFIGCWHTKFEYDLLRPITYIRRVIDPKWEPVLNTPPFPEYPSGHSTQSAAAAVVLTDAFGESFAFEDATASADGLNPRSFASFQAAAEEAGLSRLYGGIHFRAAIERGQDQGRCIAAYATALKTRS